MTNSFSIYIIIEMAVNTREEMIVYSLGKSNKSNFHHLNSLPDDMKECVLKLSWCEGYYIKTHLSGCTLQSKCQNLVFRSLKLTLSASHSPHTGKTNVNSVVRQAPQIALNIVQGAVGMQGSQCRAECNCSVAFLSDIYTEMHWKSWVQY